MFIFVLGTSVLLGMLMTHTAQNINILSMLYLTMSCDESKRFCICFVIYSGVSYVSLYQVMHC